MRANDWLLIRESRCRREGTITGAIGGCIVGIGIMIAVHLALSMYADGKHAKAVASIKQADALLLAECADIVQRTSDEQYEVVRDYTREIDRRQGVVMPWTKGEKRR